MIDVGTRVIYLSFDFKHSAGVHAFVRMASQDGVDEYPKNNALYLSTCILHPLYLHSLTFAERPHYFVIK